MFKKFLDFFRETSPKQDIVLQAEPLTETELRYFDDTFVFALFNPFIDWTETEAFKNIDWDQTDCTKAAAQEFRDLYQWWTEIRPKRIDLVDITEDQARKFYNEDTKFCARLLIVRRYVYGRN